MEAERKDTAAAIGLLILRVGLGGYLLTHGWGKLQMLLAGGATDFGDPVGLGSTLSLVLVTTSEFLCALLIILGLATRLAAVPVVITMVVAAFVVHARDPWTMEAAAKAFFSGASKTWFSKEPALLFLIPFLSLVFTGGGKLSLDGLIAMIRNPRITTEQRGSDRKEIRPAEGVALARGEVRERHLVGAADASVHVVNLAGESVRKVRQAATETASRPRRDPS